MDQRGRCVRLEELLAADDACVADGEAQLVEQQRAAAVVAGDGSPRAVARSSSAKKVSMLGFQSAARTKLD